MIKKLARLLRNLVGRIKTNMDAVFLTMVFLFRLVFISRQSTPIWKFIQCLQLH